MSKEKQKCIRCGKEMKPVYDAIAKKITGHLWECTCMPGVIVAIGN